MKSEKTLVKKIDELKELQKKIDQLTYQLEDIKTEIKSEMDERKVDELVVGPYKISYKEIVSNKFDSKKLKEENEKLYEAYVKVSKYKKLLVS